jgi:hypothetical protein
MNKTFWIQLQTHTIGYVEGVGKLSERPYFDEDKLKRAFYSLEGRYRTILIMRIDQKKTFAEIGRELNISHPRVITLEHRAYLLVYAHLVSEHGPLTWGEKPLIDAKCHDTRNIEDVIKVLTPNAIRLLKGGSYQTMQQLCAASPHRLMEIRGIGIVTIKKIEAALNVYRQRNPEFFSIA